MLRCCDKGFAETNSHIDVNVVGILIDDMFPEFDDDEFGADDDIATHAISISNGCRHAILTPLHIKKRALDVFVVVMNADARSVAAADVGRVAACIEHMALLDVVVDFASHGASVRLIHGQATSTSEWTAMTQCSGCCE